MSKPFVIGTFHQAEPVTYTEHYECAAWFQEHHVAAGDYEINACYYQGQWYFLANLPSVKGNSDFGTRFGGVAIASKRGYNEGVGDAAVYVLGLGRDSVFARRLLQEALDQHQSDRPTAITVDPTRIEFSVRTVVNEHRITLGRDPKQRYGTVTAQVPSWSVCPSVVVTRPTA